MKKLVILVPAALLAFPVAAQQQRSMSTAPASPVRVEIPQSGLTFNFQDIDRNGDNSISVEEWNAYVASLQSRLGAKQGSAASGAIAPAASGSTKPAEPPARPLSR